MKEIQFSKVNFGVIMQIKNNATPFMIGVHRTKHYKTLHQFGYGCIVQNAFCSFSMLKSCDNIFIQILLVVLRHS
jgi:hypothetical protein